MTDQFTISGKLAFDVSDAGKQVDSLKDKMKDIEKAGDDAAKKTRDEWSKTGKTLSGIGKNLTKAVTLPILAATTAAVKLSSDLTETMGKAEVVFGDNFGAIEAWSNGAIENMGLAKESALDAASTFGDLATSMGIGQSTAANMSMDLTQLAGDMASFKNISVERTQIALNGIFTGETESLKGLGIVMNETVLEQFAMNEGIGKTYRQMSQTEKVMLRYKFVMNSTKNAQGDFARTSDSVANQTRMVGERLKETGANFGNVLAPMIGRALAAVNDFLSGIMDMDEEQQKTVVTIGLVIAIIPVLISAIGGAITAYLSFQAAIKAADLAMGDIVAIIGLVVGATALLIGAFMSSQEGAEKAENKYLALARSLDDTGESAENAAEDIGQSTVNINESLKTLPDETSVTITAEDRITSKVQTAEKNVDTSVTNINTSLDGVKDATIDIDVKNNVTPEKVTIITGEIEDSFGDKELYFSVAVREADEYKAKYDKIIKDKDSLKEHIDTLVGVEKKAEFDISYKTISDELAKIEVTKVTDVDVKTIDEWTTKLAAIQLDLNTLNGDVAVELAKEQASWDALELQIDEWKKANNIEVAVSVTGDPEVVNAMAAALGGVVTAADDMPAAIERANSALDSSLTKLQEVAFESLATQLIWVASMVQSGQIGEVEGLRMTGELMSSFKAYDSQVSMTTEQQKVFVAAMTEGATPMEALAMAMDIVATGALSMDTSITSAVGGIAQLDQLNKEVRISGSHYNEIAEQTATLLDGEVSTALATAEEAGIEQKTSVEEATTAFENQKTVLDESVGVHRLQEAMIMAYTLALREGKTEVEALTLLEQEYGTAAKDVFVENWQAKTKATRGNLREVGFLQIQARQAWLVEETEYNEALNILENEKNDKITTANQTYYDKLSSIQLTYDAETLLAAEASMEAQGYVWDEGQKAKYIILVDSIAEIAAAAADGGKTIGEYMTEGEIAGMESKSGQLYTTARRIIAKAIEAMKKESDSHSPSRKTAELVGKPLADGIGVGFENNLKPLIAKVKAGTSNIIGGAAKAVNEKPNDIRVSADRAKVESKAASNIVQNNSFTARTLTPYEQRIQLKKLNNDLAGVFA